ncbi:MAG: DivIVA domain-containing protein [Faecalibacterium sp.]|nr:DivIVA domain-containing protein [Ruminococcus sp.]MCM1391752.1 DivIVA domain-containing protein [Ruminococcus sp.]MCM1485032.1 DivIVA domain-containing protein [Faecalibacterium sp.]
MLVPNQIKNFTFQSAGRGAYKAADVEAFKQKVYTAYSELFSEHSAVKGKFSSLASLVEEYNEGKNAIATTMIKAQSFADETINQANEKAEQILAEANSQAEQILGQKKQEADLYAAEKTANADSYLSRAESELDSVLKKASKEAEAYIASVNEKAAAIIANANEQASKIVAAAYGDAQKARNTCDDIVNQANAKLVEIKAEVAEFRKETKRLLSIITPVVDDIDVPDDLPSFESSDNTYEEENEPVVQPIEDFEPFKFDPYAASEFESQSTKNESIENDTDMDDEIIAEVEGQEDTVTDDEINPSVISEKLSASIFKSLDDFDKLIDISSGDMSDESTDGESNGFGFNDSSLTDFDEE